MLLKRPALTDDGNAKLPVISANFVGIVNLVLIFFFFLLLLVICINEVLIINLRYLFKCRQLRHDYFWVRKLLRFLSGRAHYRLVMRRAPINFVFLFEGCLFFYYIRNRTRLNFLMLMRALSFFWWRASFIRWATHRQRNRKAHTVLSILTLLRTLFYLQLLLGSLVIFCLLQWSTCLLKKKES